MIPKTMSTETRSKNVPISFEQAVLKTKVAQICEHVGFHSITQDSSNILIDIYRRIIHSIGRHCNESANNNRRVETTLIDLEHAYDFVGISLSSLHEYIEAVKLPLDIKLEHEEQRPSNRIQRNLLVDDLLENEKNSHPDEPDDGEAKAMSESGVEEEEKPNIPLLKDVYEGIVNKFSDFIPVAADKKIRLGGRIVLVANTKLKISPPVPPEPIPSTSGLDVKAEKKKKKKEVEKKKEIEKKKATETKAKQKSPVKQTKGTKGRRKKKISKEFIISEPADVDKDDEKVELAAKETSNEVDELLDITVKEEREDELKSKEDLEKEQVRETEPLQEELEEEKERKEAELEKVLEVKEKEVKESKSRGKSKSKEKGKAKAKDKEKARDKEKGKGKDKDKEKTKDKGKDKDKDEDKESSKSKEKGKGRASKSAGSKKTKAITPLDPAIAEPPSFFPILEAKIEEPELEDNVLETIQPLPSVSTTPNPPTKQSKGKKKKKANNQFAIVTETVTAAAEDKEWFCPACGGPDDGDLMVQCDTCQEWYHLGCTNLSKPPEDDENWECEICINKAKLQKKPLTPVIVEPIKTKTPEPKLVTPPPPIPPPTATAGMSQDDLCPECNLPDDGTMMIQCDDPHCARWFHGKCVSLLEEPKEDESWFCKACVEKQQSAFKRRRRAK